MNLSDQDLLGVYSTIKEQGHPDPIGFLARSELLSGLDPAFSKGNKFGITGLSQENVARVEGGDASDLISNMAAAVKVDADNFANFKDVSNMHVAFESGGEAVADRSKRPRQFLRQLAKGKVKWDKRIKSIQKEFAERPKSVITTEDDLRPRLNVQEQSFAQGDSTPLVASGDASKLDSIRQNGKQVVAKKGVKPKALVTKAKTQLRELIRSAVRNA